ncbi:MAG: hypothetical protein BWY95_01606 [Bacteroidetes bacterium ADurb.BinA104]|nr:MAG: hypothetical protein BWY95_01606 [Bacteroidetes bacterium ADurb.BinA104]
MLIFPVEGTFVREFGHIGPITIFPDIDLKEFVSSLVTVVEFKVEVEPDVGASEEASSKVRSFEGEGVVGDRRSPSKFGRRYRVTRHGRNFPVAGIRIEAPAIGREGRSSPVFRPRNGEAIIDIDASRTFFNGFCSRTSRESIRFKVINGGNVVAIMTRIEVKVVIFGSGFFDVANEGTISVNVISE